VCDLSACSVFNQVSGSDQLRQDNSLLHPQVGMPDGRTVQLVLCMYACIYTPYVSGRQAHPDCGSEVLVVRVLIRLYGWYGGGAYALPSLVACVLCFALRAPCGMSIHPNACKCLHPNPQVLERMATYLLSACSDTSDWVSARHVMALFQQQQEQQQRRQQELQQEMQVHTFCI
jgi:hypothetical protein